MGVFTVGRQVALEIDMPGWWLANASVDMDFRRGRYYDSSTANPRAATDFLSCTRASVGYAKTAEGTLTQFASNILRVTSNGLLIEDARTNLVTRSQDFSDAVWNKDGTSIGATTTAPDGTSTASLAVANATTGTHAVYENQNNLSVSYTWSVYLKAGGYNYGFLMIIDGSDNRSVVIVDLTTGAVTDTHTTGSPAATTTTTEMLANGWVRVTTNLASGATGWHVWGPSNSATPSYGGACFPNYTGDGSSGVYGWGAQLELASFASSYIPTTSAAATRAADAVSVSGNLDTLLKASARSSVVDLTALSTPATWDIISGSTAGDELVVSSSDVVITSNTTTKSFSGSGAFTTGVKVGAGTSGSSTSVTGAGLTVQTGSSGVANTGTVYLGSDATNYWYGYIRRATFFNSKLADATLQALTAP